MVALQVNLVSRAIVAILIGLVLSFFVTGSFVFLDLIMPRVNQGTIILLTFGVSLFLTSALYLTEFLLRRLNTKQRILRDICYWCYFFTIIILNSLHIIIY